MKKFKKRTLVVCLITALILPSLQISLSAHAETINEDNENKTDDVMEHLQDAAEQDGALTYDEDQVSGSAAMKISKNLQTIVHGISGHRIKW